MAPLVLAGLGLDPELAHTFSKPLAWLAIAGVVYLLLRSSLVPVAVKLVVGTVAFVAALGWADHVGLLQAVTGHDVDDADKLLVALGATFVLWLAFLREDRPRRSGRSVDELPVRVLTRGRR
ncbi:MAG: hypothetical protein ACRDKW_07935 [Actinomycetota bacterium]